MQKPLNHKAINWVDGMKLSSSQFVQSDLFHQDTVRDAISVNLNAVNYGILPPFQGYEKGAEIVIVEKASMQLEASVYFCNAITADGCRIDIPVNSNGSTAQFNQYLSTDNLTEGIYYIVIKVNTLDRNPVGNPDPQETPLRFPELDKTYTFEIVPERELNRMNAVSFFLPVGQFTVDKQEIRLNKNYIPPCAALNSHIALRRAHGELYALINEFQSAAFKIMDKTSQKDRISDIGLNVRAISEKMLYFQAETMYSYRVILPMQSPQGLVHYFSDLTHLFFTAIKLIPAGQREELLNYFYEWKDVTPSNFEERISEMIEIQYEHLDCEKSIQRIMDFMTVLVPLWMKLSTLEFIGQRKENIVVAEQTVVQEVQKKRTWSLLD